MATLPGWGGGRLAVAAQREVEAARHIVYASALRPLVRQDFDTAIAGLENVDRAPSTERDRRERQASIIELRAGKREQARIREILELDVDVDDEDGAP